MKPDETFGLSETMAFVKRQLDFGASDTGQIDRTPLTDRLYKLITSGQFRRSAIDARTEHDIRVKLDQRVSCGEPIAFSVPFGAYKSWQLDSYPEPDWAEVFNLNYLCKFACGIAAVYEPGITINYTYTDDVMDIVSNLPRSDTKRYAVAFTNLLGVFQLHCPSNIKLNFVRINDYYGEGELQRELEENYRANLATWDQKYSENDRAYKMRSAMRNVHPNGVVDLRGLSPSEWEARWQTAAMWCDALDGLHYRRWFNKYSTNIQIIFVRGRDLSLHFGSCETSTTQFWVGTGIIQLDRMTARQRILSATAANKVRSELTQVDIVGPSEFLGVSGNYRAIAVGNAS